MFPHFIQPHLIINNLHSDMEPHPNHKENGGKSVFIGSLRVLRKLVVKQMVLKVVDFGRFWRKVSPLFPLPI